MTSLLWSACGRRLTSGGLDGLLIVWDVLSGEALTTRDLGGKGITHASTPEAPPLPSGSSSSDSGSGEALLLSFVAGPARLLGADGATRELPAIALGALGREGRDGPRGRTVAAL